MHKIEIGSRLLRPLEIHRWAWRMLKIREFFVLRRYDNFGFFNLSSID